MSNHLQVKSRTHLFYQKLDRKKVEIEIIFHAGGSIFEGEGDRGKKHLLEHCIASRTKDMNFQDLKDWQFEKNIILNAYTGPLTMGLTAEGHKEDFLEMFKVLWEMAVSPTFDQSILDREKEIVLREISERRGDPAYQLYFDVNALVFTPDSYDNHQVLGDEKMVAQTTIEDLYRLHQESLAQSHIIVLLAGGGIELEPVLQILRDFDF